MLFATILFVLFQCFIAVMAPTTFIYFSLWVQTMPYTWNWDTQLVYDTPIGPLNVVAMRMFGFCLACLLVVVTHLNRAMFQTKYLRWHIGFIVFCLLSLTYAASAAYGLRMIAKLLGPLFFMITILAVIKSEEELAKMRNAILGSGVVLVALALLARASGIDSDPNVSVSGLSGLGPPGMGPPVFAAHMLPVAMLALATYLGKPGITKLALVIMSAAATLAALQRTSAAALYLGFSIILVLGTRGIWRVVLPTLGLVGLPALMVFSATFRRRMFFGDASSDQLLADPAKAVASVNGSGRFDLWDSMLGRFFEPHPLIGSGVGSTQDYLYGRAGAGVVHSEYVRLLCEVGLVGLVLFALALLTYLWRLRRYTPRSNNVSLRISALAAIGGVTTYLVYCSTDNAFDYVSQFGIYVFGMVAIAIKSSELAAVVHRDTRQPLGPREQLFPNLMT